MTDTTSPPAQPCAALLDELLSWYFDHNPVHATFLGAPGRDTTLGDYSEGSFRARVRQAREWVRRLESLDDGMLSVQDTVDRDLVLAMFRGELATADWPAWQRDPARYTDPIFTSLHVPFLHRIRTDAELVAAAESKLAEAPEVLAACRANLDPELAPPLIVQRALDQARTARQFLTRTLPAEVTDTDLRSRLATAAEPVAAAFDDLVVFLTDFVQRARGDWRMGERIYSTLLIERESLGYGAAELHQRGLLAYAELDAELQELALRTAAALDNLNDSPHWTKVMERLQDDHPATLEAMRAEYAAETARARAFLAEHDLVPFAAGEHCHVVHSPNFLRPLFGVPFYISPPPLTGGRVGHFFVPHTPDSFTAEQVEQRLRTNSRVQMPTTAVHETYPGHHWHLSWMAGGNRTVRKVFRTPYFTEGWALYAERLMREHGYFSEHGQELAHLEARIFRAARIVVDTELHCGDMTIEQAERFMVSKTALNPGTAATEVSRYCAWPTQAPAYLTGALEIDRIRADYLATGRGDLRAFHAVLAGSGGLPLGLARRVAMEA